MADQGAQGVGFVPHTDSEMESMARSIGLSQPEDVFAEIPKHLLCSRPLLGRSARSQNGILAEGSALARKTRLDRPTFLGAGFYDRMVPPALVETILRRTDYYSAYTPYQAEASQGILQGLFEYQRAICALTGLDVANASLYDGATALAEAVLCLFGASEHKSGTVYASTAVHPHYRAVLRTYLSDLPLRLVEIPFVSGEGRTNPEMFRPDDRSPVIAVIAQNPNLFGVIEDMRSLAAAAHTIGAGFVHIFEPASLSVLAAPGEVGADIAVAEGQSLGLPMVYGGLALGVFAAREKYLRRLPGRLVGKTLDALGQEAYCLTLQTREQHIRREKATSNICTNHTLCAIYAGAYVRLLGAAGLRAVAETSAARMEQFLDGLRRLDRVAGPAFGSASLFEVAIRAKCKLDHLPVLDLHKYYSDLPHTYLVSFTERRTESDVEWLLSEIEKSGNR